MIYMSIWAFIHRCWERLFPPEHPKFRGFQISVAEGKELWEDLARALDECEDHGVPFVAKTSDNTVQILVKPDFFAR